MSKKIVSLDDLRRRKKKVRKKLAKCEDRIMEHTYELTYPFTTLFSSSVMDENEDYEKKLSPFYQKIYRLAMNAKRFFEIFKMGKSIYSDFKK